jgi:hypothetical protein
MKTSNLASTFRVQGRSFTNPSHFACLHGVRSGQATMRNIKMSQAAANISGHPEAGADDREWGLHPSPGGLSLLHYSAIICCLREGLHALDNRASFPVRRNKGRESPSGSAYDAECLVLRAAYRLSGRFWNLTTTHTALHRVTTSPIPLQSRWQRVPTLLIPAYSGEVNGGSQTLQCLQYTWVRSGVKGESHASPFNPPPGRASGRDVKCNKMKTKKKIWGIYSKAIT